MNNKKVQPSAFLWALQGQCALYRKPFSTELAAQQLCTPYTPDFLVRAAHALGLNAVSCNVQADKFKRENFSLVAWHTPKPSAEKDTVDSAETNGSTAVNEDMQIDSLIRALVLQADASNVLVIEPDDATPATISIADFATRYAGNVTRVTPKADPATDPDSEAEARMARRFSFSWFIPELLKHMKLWHEVLLASFVIQLIALATPLFTQTIIDKVVVHRIQSTLTVIAIGMAIFILFSAALSWLRQYLVLHTGNRVEAVLGSSVFERLFKLPPLYFQHRPTGVIAGRLQGIETICEFIASAAVTLVLIFSFLLIFVAIMF